MVGAIGAPKGGCLIVVATNKIVTEKLSVPHSLAERDLLARIRRNRGCTTKCRLFLPLGCACDRVWIRRSNTGRSDPHDRGFMAVGSPERLIDELVRQGKRKLTVIANHTAMPGSGIGKLFSAGLISKVIASHLGLNPETQQQMIASKSPSSLCRKARSPSAFALEGSGLAPNPHAYRRWYPRGGR